MFRPNPNDALNYDAQRLTHSMTRTPLPCKPGTLIQLRQFEGNGQILTEKVQHSETLSGGSIVIFTHLVNPVGQVVDGTHWEDSDIQAAIAE